MHSHFLFELCFVLCSTLRNLTRLRISNFQLSDLRKGTRSSRKGGCIAFDLSHVFMGTKLKNMQFKTDISFFSVRYMVVYDNHEVGKDKLPEKKEIIPLKKETKTVNEETYAPKQLVHQQHETTEEKQEIGRNDLIAIVVGCVAVVILSMTALVGLYHLVWKKARASNGQPARQSSILNDCNVSDSSNVRMISLHEHRTRTNKGAVRETETHQHLLEFVEQKV